MKTIALVSLVLAACAGDGSGPQPSLPDASTQMGEDAPLPPPPDGPSNACSVSDPNSCSGETICIASQCEQAFGRIYRFYGVAATVAAHNTGGSAWDPLGGAPDPQVTVKLQGETVLTTGVSNDTFQASFTQTADHEILAGEKLELVLVDSDVNANDGILTCAADPLTADFLRAGGVMCSGSGTSAGSSVTLLLAPK